MTGAPRPGGKRAPVPGGMKAPAAGGLDLDNEVIANLHARTPDVTFNKPNNITVPLAAFAVTAVPTLGIATVSSYAWTLPIKPGGSSATAATPTTATSGFTADVAGVYELQVVVTFSNGVIITKRHKVTAAA
jgi:hypothetical protein